MDKPKPTSQNIQIKGETLDKMDILRDAASKQGVQKSYPAVVADAVNLFYDVSTGARSAATRDEVAEERAVALGISCMNILITVVHSGQNVKECECIAQPGLDVIGIILPNGHPILMPAMGADSERVFFHTRDLLIRTDTAKQEAGADGPISPIDLDQVLGRKVKEN